MHRSFPLPNSPELVAQHAKDLVEPTIASNNGGGKLEELIRSPRVSKPPMQSVQRNQLGRLYRSGAQYNGHLRREVLELLEQGVRPVTVAKQCCVSEAYVSKWRKQLSPHGRGPGASSKSKRASFKLQPAQREYLVRALQMGKSCPSVKQLHSMLLSETELCPNHQRPSYSTVYRAVCQIRSESKMLSYMATENGGEVDVETVPEDDLVDHLLEPVGPSAAGSADLGHWSMYGLVACPIEELFQPPSEAAAAEGNFVDPTTSDFRLRPCLLRDLCGTSESEEHAGERVALELDNEGDRADQGNTTQIPREIPIEDILHLESVNILL